MSSDAEENDFIHKMLLTNNIKVENGRLLLLGRPGLLLNANIFASVLGKLMEYSSNDIYELGGFSVNDIALDYKKRFKDQSSITDLLKNVVSCTGIGSLSVGFFKDQILIELFPSVLAESHIKLFGLSDKPVCFLSAGAFNSILSTVFDKPYSTREVECVAQGKQKCKFICEEQK